MNELILIVEDEPQIAKLAKDYLERSGYKTLIANDGNLALATARREKPDLIILDLMLPGIDGLDICRIIRRDSAVPIIMLTARSEESDRLIGLELGADDYLVKPFSPKELVARVRAVLRRSQGAVIQQGIIRVKDIEIDLNAHKVSRNGQQIHLTPSEFKILVTFAQHPGQALSREQIIIQLGGNDFEGLDRSIDSHIKNIRRKLEPDPANPQYLFTVYGVGYRFDDYRFDNEGS